MKWTQGLVCLLGLLMMRSELRKLRGNYTVAPNFLELELYYIEEDVDHEADDIDIADVTNVLKVPVERWPFIDEFKKWE